MIIGIFLLRDLDGVEWVPGSLNLDVGIEIPTRAGYIPLLRYRDGAIGRRKDAYPLVPTAHNETNVYSGSLTSFYDKDQLLNDLNLPANSPAVAKAKFYLKHYHFVSGATGRQFNVGGTIKSAKT